jgi:hypothetical protein
VQALHQTAQLSLLSCSSVLKTCLLLHLLLLQVLLLLLLLLVMTAAAAAALARPALLLQPAQWQQCCEVRSVLCSALLIA